MTAAIPCSSVRTTKNRKKGFTLTEIAIVLGIIGLILGAVWSAASGVYANANSTKLSQQLGMYIAAVRSACSSSACLTSASLTNGQIAAPLPTISGASSVAPAIITPTGQSNWVELQWNNIPTSSAGIAFCHGMQTAAAQIGAAISNATNGGQVVVAAPSCASAAGAAQCASASYTLTQGGNCTAGVPPAGSNCFWNPANLCNTGQATLFVAFDQSF